MRDETAIEAPAAAEELRRKRPLEDELISTSPPTACSMAASSFCFATTSS